MSALNHIQFKHIGFESRNLSRRPRRFELHSELLEFRRLLSTGQGTAAAVGPDHSQAISNGTSTPSAISTAPPASVATVSPAPPSSSAPVASPTTAAQANLPTDNSSTTNTPGVSPMEPAPLDVVTDDSPSVITSPTSLFTALIPNTSPFITSSGPEVFLVPMADSTTIELSIATPSFEATSPAAAVETSVPVILHAINAPVEVQANSVSPGAQNQQPTSTSTSMGHIGQEIETELQKPLKPQLGPQPDAPELIDVVVPPRQPHPPAEPSKPEQPEQPGTERPKTEPKAEPPMDATRPQEHAPPVQNTPPAWWPLWLPLPVAIPAADGAPPAASTASSPDALRPSMNGQTGVSAFLGVVAIAGGFPAAMGESQRFGMRWLPPGATPRPVGRVRPWMAKH
jgi:hypothetical protein